MDDESLSACSPCLDPENAEELVRQLERQMCPDGMSFPQYLEVLQSSGQARCTALLTRDSLAYRCRTCQLDDTSSICVDCFLRGEHKSHDYVMYRSTNGGSCDCGDPDLWQETGFCSAHRSVDCQEPSLPPELEGLTKFAVGTVVDMLSFIIGGVSVPEGGPPVDVLTEVETSMVFLDWLKKLCYADALRKIVCSEFVQITANDRKTRELESPLQVLLKTFAGMPEVIMEAETSLFLQMLRNPNFKQQYSEELMNHYSAMIESTIIADGNSALSYGPSIERFEALDSSLDRVMVQFLNFSNMELIMGKDLLRLFVMNFGKILKRCVLSDTNAVYLRDPRIVHKMYLRPLGDLRLIFRHPSVTSVLLEERADVFTSILDVLVLLQWMSPFTSTKSVDFEVQNEWTLAIQLEMETMAVVSQIFLKCFAIYRPELEDPMGTLLSASRRTLLLAASRALERLLEYLMKEASLNFLSDTSANASMSLHIPLHRTLSSVLAKLVLLPWNDAKGGFLGSLNFSYSETEVLALMEHPLGILVWMAQIRARRWVEASEDFGCLELIYRGSFWCDQSMDMDILILQFCAVARENMERAVFIRMAERFELKELVSSPRFEHDRLVGDRIMLLHDFIRLVLLVVHERRNTGMNEEEYLRYEVIQFLCVKNQTYSQLCRNLSSIPVNHTKVHEILDDVAHFHAPEVQERGYYELKSECWQEFDPLFAHFYPNELEDAQGRAIQLGKLPYYWRIKPSGVVKEPYNRLINLLHTEECHQLLWNVLNYVSASVMNDPSRESLGVLALQMMGLALQDRRDNPVRFPAASEVLQSPLASSDDIYYNVHRRPKSNQSTMVVEWGICRSEYPSILDLLRKLQDVTNAPRLLDSVQYVMHLLTASPYSATPGGSPADREFVLSPELHARVHSTDDAERLQKKHYEEALRAQFKSKYDISTVFNSAIREPLSKILSYLRIRGLEFLGSLLKWVRIRSGISVQQILSRNKGQVKSKDLITGRFLGQGCSGIFYETTWSQNSTVRFARKDFPGVSGDTFASEAVRLFELRDHPNIVKTFSWTVDNRSCSLVMEYMKDDLSSFMRKKMEVLRKRSGKVVIGVNPSPFQLLEALDILLQIAVGVEYLHDEGIYHGDLKPNNVLIDWKGGQMLVKVADFGLLESKRTATLISQRALSYQMIEWSAPELLEDYLRSFSEDLDFSGSASLTELDPSTSGPSCSENGQKILLEKADSYSFGLTSAYILGAGQIWPAKLSLEELQQQISSSVLRPDLPSECPEMLASLILSCWDTDPTCRPTFSAIRNKIEEIVKEQRQHQEELGVVDNMHCERHPPEAYPHSSASPSGRDVYAPGCLGTARDEPPQKEQRPEDTAAPRETVTVAERQEIWPERSSRPTPDRTEHLRTPPGTDPRGLSSLEDLPDDEHQRYRRQLHLLSSCFGDVVLSTPDPVQHDTQPFISHSVNRYDPSESRSLWEQQVIVDVAQLRRFYLKIFSLRYAS